MSPGMVAQFASVETVGGQVTNLKVSLDTYIDMFTLISWLAIGLGVLLLLLAGRSRSGCTASPEMETAEGG